MRSAHLPAAVPAAVLLGEGLCAPAPGKQSPSLGRSSQIRGFVITRFIVYIRTHDIVGNHTHNIADTVCIEGNGVGVDRRVV